MNRSHVILLLTAALFAGCSTSLPPFTQDVRTGTPLAECVFYLGASLEFRSVRVLDMPDTSGIFRTDGIRYIRLSKEEPGTAVAQGEGWIAVDFGRGIVLQFRQSEPQGIYTMPGWGTVSIGRERYDIEVGVLSGTSIQLLWQPLKPGESRQ